MAESYVGLVAFVESVVDRDQPQALADLKRLLGEFEELRQQNTKLVQAARTAAVLIDTTTTKRAQDILCDAWEATL